MYCDLSGHPGVTRSYQRVTKEPRIFSLIVNFLGLNKYPTVPHSEGAESACFFAGAAGVIIGTVHAVVGDHHPVAFCLHDWPRVFIKPRGVSLSCIVTLGVLQG